MMKRVYAKYMLEDLVPTHETERILCFLLTEVGGNLFYRHDPLFIAIYFASSMDFAVGASGKALDALIVLIIQIIRLALILESYWYRIIDALVY